jgi:teichuronic acid biosynthesis glycosyltransferase TuaG
MVSIIIPIYNAEKYVIETINSVINQTHTNWELILIDDGSTDQSQQIITEIGKKEQRIKIISQENSGVSIARNTGIKCAKGKVIAFLDSDDCWKNNHLKNRLAIFDKNSSVKWLFGSIELIDENNNSLNQVISGADDDILNSLLKWDGNTITTPSTICVKKECLHSFSFDENLSTAADQDFAIQLASKYRGKYVEEPTVLYRVLPNSMSSNIEVMEKDHILVFQKAAHNKLFKSFMFKQKCFSNLYWILAGSWWKDGQNRLKGTYFILLALINNPFSIFRLLKASTK